MEQTTLSDDDEGKRVVNSQGKKIGMVTEVRNGTAYVDPNPGIADSLRSKLGWGDADANDYRLESRRITKITDDEIQVKY